MSSPTYLSLLRHSITRRTIWSIKKTPPNRTHHGRGLECGTWWGWIHFLPSSHLSTVQQPVPRHRLMANVRARVLPTNRKCRMPRRNSGNGTPKKDNEKYPVKATNAASRCCCHLLACLLAGGANGWWYCFRLLRLVLQGCSFHAMMMVDPCCHARRILHRGEVNDVCSR